MRKCGEERMWVVCVVGYVIGYVVVCVVEYVVGYVVVCVVGYMFDVNVCWICVSVQLRRGRSMLDCHLFQMH